MGGTSIRKFQPKLDDARLEDLRKRLDLACEHEAAGAKAAHFESTKERFGLTHKRFVELLHAWRKFVSPEEQEKQTRRPGPDDDTWQAFEKHLDTFSHYTTTVEDVELHFIHERASVSPGRKVIPLLLLHGWPGSFIEFLNVIKPLAHPGDDAPPDTPAFHIVVPSHAGYVFSSAPKVDASGRGRHSGPDGDFLVADEARLVHKLMLRLGYEQYAVQGGDWGSSVARNLGVKYPDHVKAIHLNFIPAPAPRLTLPALLSPIRALVPIRFDPVLYLPQPLRSLVDAIQDLTRGSLARSLYLQSWPRPFLSLGHWFLGTPAPLTSREQVGVRRSETFVANGSAYSVMQGTRPSTLGIICASDPAALLAWIGEKFLQWSDEDPDDAEIAASLTLWWCTDTMPKSLYNYRNRLPGGPQWVSDMRQNYIYQPCGYSSFPKEIIPSPRSWSAATCNLRWFRSHEAGGHFAAMERPAEFVEDVRDCFHALWR